MRRWKKVPEGPNQSAIVHRQCTVRQLGRRWLQSVAPGFQIKAAVDAGVTIDDILYWLEPDRDHLRKLMQWYMPRVYKYGSPTQVLALEIWIVKRETTCGTQ